jgi:hypothetical protein
MQVTTSVTAVLVIDTSEEDDGIFVTTFFGVFKYSVHQTGVLSGLDLGVDDSLDIVCYNAPNLG